MARMKDCPECKAGDIRPEDWSPDDGPYPQFTKRELKREHSYHSVRYGPHHWENLVFRPNGAYVGTLIHHGRK